MSMPHNKAAPNPDMPKFLVEQKHGPAIAIAITTSWLWRIRHHVGVPYYLHRALRISHDRAYGGERGQSRTCATISWVATLYRSMIVTTTVLSVYHRRPM